MCGHSINNTSLEIGFNKLFLIEYVIDISNTLYSKDEFAGGLACN
ncbi:hypothetical protein [Candidatus Nitrosocosmicus sp. T]